MSVECWCDNLPAVVSSTCHMVNTILMMACSMPLKLNEFAHPTHVSIARTHIHSQHKHTHGHTYTHTCTYTTY